jgi:hypothetical protein
MPGGRVRVAGACTLFPRALEPDVTDPTADAHASRWCRRQLVKVLGGARPEGGLSHGERFRMTDKHTVRRTVNGKVAPRAEGDAAGAA